MTLAPMAAWEATFELLAGDELAHFGDEGAAAFVGEVAVDDDGERVDGLAGDEDIQFDHGRLPCAGEVVVERCVTAADTFQAVVKA